LRKLPKKHDRPKDAESSWESSPSEYETVNSTQLRDEVIDASEFDSPDEDQKRPKKPKRPDYDPAEREKGKSPSRPKRRKEEDDSSSPLDSPENSDPGHGDPTNR
jgi:hypothetical protein